MGADLIFQKRITGNLMVYQDRLEAYLLLIFAHQQISEWFSVISAIIFEVNIVAKKKQALLVVIFLLFNFSLSSTLLLPPCPTVVPASLKKR